MCAAIDAGAPQRQRCPESGLWRLRFRVVGRYTDAPPEFAPCTVHTNKDSPLLRRCRDHANADRHPALELEPSPARHEPRGRSSADGLPGGLFRRPARRPARNCGSQALRGHFSYRWQIDTELFVDDAGSCPVKKQLPAVAGIASSVALLSVESSSAEAS